MLKFLANNLILVKKKKNVIILSMVIYYIDTSVLPENMQLVKFIKTTSGTRVVYFSESHSWVYRWRNFRNFHPKFVGVLRLLNFTYTILLTCFQSFADILSLQSPIQLSVISEDYYKQCLILLYCKFEPSQLLFGK